MKTLQVRIKRMGFTLIELLVVMAIIGLLAALLFPAFNNALLSGKKTRVKAEVKQLEIAFKAVKSDYRGWPNGFKDDGEAYDVDSVVVRFLSSAASANDKKIIYMEFSAGSTNSAQAFIDPWKNAYKYSIAAGSGGIKYGGTMIYREMGMWSRGKDGNDSSVETRKDDITSWAQ